MDRCPIFQILLEKCIIKHFSIAQGTQKHIFSPLSDCSSTWMQRNDAGKQRFVRAAQLNEDELPIQGYLGELCSIGQHDLRIKFQAVSVKAPEHANDAFRRE